MEVEIWRIYDDKVSDSSIQFEFEKAMLYETLIAKTKKLWDATALLAYLS